MLLELHVQDFALIDRLAVAFGPGLNAITGDTGSGKSLLVTALELVAGARPRGGAGAWVRSGAERATIEARFALPGEGTGLGADVAEWFEANLPELGHEHGDAWRDEGELLLVRVLESNGRSRARVQGRTVTVAALGELVRRLLDVHGQFEQRGIDDPAQQLAWFDEVAEHTTDLPIAERRAAYVASRRAWLDARADHVRLLDASAARDGRETFLRLAVEELERLDAKPGEARELESERHLLRQSTRVVSELGGAAGALSEGDDPLVSSVASLADRVASWSSASPKLAHVAEELGAALVHLEEAAQSLVSFLGGVEADPARLEWIETRLHDLERLARRHDATPDGLAARAAEVRAELDGLEDLEARRDDAERRESEALARLVRDARALDEARRAAAPAFAAALRPHLDALGLESAELWAEFEVDSEDGDDPQRHFGPSGASPIVVAWRPNPGEPAQPLARIASGGEAARVFLALRCVAAGPVDPPRWGGGGGTGGDRPSRAGTPRGDGAVRTLLFDEVDAAVGGRLAPRVGDALAALGTVSQVVTVTHQPAIAARAHRHVAVRKRTSGGRTASEARALEGTERIAEVAAMIGGPSASAAARAEAGRMLGLDREPLGTEPAVRATKRPRAVPRRSA
ncbi:MAG: AAA family ATPase [Planctomycetota bacterium]